jgi:hypothetical protein
VYSFKTQIERVITGNPATHLNFINFYSEESSIPVNSLIKISFLAGCWWLMPVI